MSVQFSKLQEVDLSLKDTERGDDEIEVIGSSPPEETALEDDSKCIIQENSSAPSKRPIWKFWEKRYRYSLSNRYMSSKLRCRRCKCKVNSWRAVIVALLLFTAAVLISVVVSRLATEPEDDTPESQIFQLKSGVLINCS